MNHPVHSGYPLSEFAPSAAPTTGVDRDPNGLSGNRVVGVIESAVNSPRASPRDRL
jgi:hypothetical protein